MARAASCSSGDVSTVTGRPGSRARTGEVERMAAKKPATGKRPRTGAGEASGTGAGSARAGAAGASGAGPAASPPADIAVPRQLLEHLRDRRLVLFAGAGLSVQAGLPTWRSLIEDVVQRTVAEAIEGEQASAELKCMLAAGKWLQIADHCKEKLGPGGYARLLAERLSDAGRPVPDVHRLAVRLPFAAWVTTNYDKLLERAYAEERGGLPKTLTNLDTAALGQLLFDGAPFVLKAHGDLTSRDYRDHIHGNTAFSAAFSAVLLTHSVLFVGYSLSDPDFNLLLDRQLLTFQGFVPERYALMSGIGKVEEEYLWRVCRIRVIPYPEGRHESVLGFFQQLADRLAQEDKTGAALQVLTAGLGPLLEPGAGAAAKRSIGGVAASGEVTGVSIVQLGGETTTAAGARRVSGAVARARTVVSERAVPAPPPLVLSLAWADGSVQTTVSDGSTMLASASVSAERWSKLAAASRQLESRSGRKGTIAIYGHALAEMLGDGPVALLGEALEAAPARSVRLELTRQTERVSWELVRLESLTLAERAPVFRAPVGVSERARGLPPVAVPLRALVIGDTTAESALGSKMLMQPLPGAAEEAREVAALIERGGAGTVRLLLGAEATYEAVAAAFEELRPDVLHFAGHAWFDDREAYLVLADTLLLSSMMRPWLTRRSPAFMFLNSHFTAFIPAGVEATLGGGQAGAVQAGLGGRAGFADLAMKSGVGAFVGSYSGAIDDNGARDFALAVYDALLRGATVADAVHASRRDLPQANDDATALLFCTYGAGDLRLVVNRTQEAGDG
jgi:hypothetical protein